MAELIEQFQVPEPQLPDNGAGHTDLAARITTAALPAAGAALSGYLSVTFLKTFGMTSQQMSYYYGQPLVHCYLPHADWLTDRFDPQTDSTARTAIHRELIQAAALDASRNAQRHLLRLRKTGASHPGISHPVARALPANGRYPNVDTPR